MFDLTALIKSAGYLGLFGIVFAESGLFIGFILPGDSLLFTAGFLASQGYLNLFFLIVILFAGAVLGDNFGYNFGKRVGPKIFTREDSFIFHKDNLERAQIFYGQYGAKAIVLARFVPIVRTFAPILAGVGRMKYSVFLFYNIIGAVLWVIGITMSGYILGNIVPDADRYILPIVIVIIIVSVSPVVFKFLKKRKK